MSYGAAVDRRGLMLGVLGARGGAAAAQVPSEKALKITEKHTSLSKPCDPCGPLRPALEP